MSSIQKKLKIVFIVFVSIIAIYLLILGLIRLWKEMEYQNLIRDQEHWHGVVSEKKLEKRKTTYNCNPRQVPYTATETYTKSDGSTGTRSITKYRTEYDTCYRHVFDTLIKLSFGDKIYFDRGVQFDDTRTRSTTSKEPGENQISQEWKKVNVGDPASAEKDYKNYLKANKDSLFGQDYTSKTKRALEKYGGLVPNWPKVYDKYKIDQFIQVDAFEGVEPYQKLNEDEMKELNQLLFEINGRLNNPDNFEDKKIKEVSTIVMLIPDQMDDMYFAVDEKWEGVNKNELVIYLNLDSQNHCTRVQVQGWSISKYVIETELDSYCYSEFGINSKNNLNKDNLRKVLDKSEELIKEHFTRKEMEEFEYIDQENRQNRKL